MVSKFDFRIAAASLVALPVRSVMSIPGRAVVFPKTPSGEEAAQALYLCNMRDSPVSLAFASSLPRLFRASADHVLLDRYESISLDVFFTPQAQGDYEVHPSAVIEAILRGVGGVVLVIVVPFCSLL